MMDFKKTAVFGGTFNPPHLGHRFMLEGISGLNEIGKILVMPAKTPPHKSDEIVSAEHRVNMCRLAFDGVPKAEISLEELSLEGKSYTINTLEHLKQKGIKNPVLVLGADSLVTFHKWYCYKEILSLAELYVYNREGIDENGLISAKNNLEGLGGKITLLSICPPAISSSFIRAALLEGKIPKEFLESSVVDYIGKYSLYEGR